MTSILHCTEIDPANKFVGRAAQRQIVSGLNFAILNLLQRNLEERARGSENTTDRPYSNAEDVGHNFAHQDPQFVAGQLKVIRNAFASSLLAHATVKRNFKDPTRKNYLDPYEVGETFEQTIRKQIERLSPVDRKRATAKAAILGAEVEDVIRVELIQHETRVKFLLAHQAALLREFDDLDQSRVDGRRWDGTLEEVEEMELLIPAIHRARLYVNAERGLFYERDRAIVMFIRRRPEAKGNLSLVDIARAMIHKHFDELMKDPEFYKQIDEAVRRGAKWPTLMDLPKARPY